MIVQGKAWGSTVPLFTKNNVEIHSVAINKGGYCSKHRHIAKYNKFIVSRGKLKVTIWKQYTTEILEDVTFLGAGQSCIVSPGDWHMFEALEDTEALEVYWVELRENDIERQTYGGRRK